MSSAAMKEKLSIKNISYFSLFIVVELLVFVVFHTINLMYHGYPISSLFINLFTRYDDYFVHLGLAAYPFGTNIYALNDMACFPPLAYLLYAFLARMVGYSVDAPASADDHQAIGHNLAIYVLYTVICIVLLVYAVSLYFKKKGVVSLVILPCILILTYPVAFTTIQRGNSVLLVVSLVSIALAWRNDESKVKRELAMILIAVAAGLKIYPAVLGLLYLKERRLKETIRLVIYGVVLFFVPFIFFGGFDGMKTFFTTLLHLNGDVHRCSVSGLVEAITTGLFGNTIHGFTVFLQQLFLVLCLAAFFFTKDKWGELLALCSLMTVYISSSWMYTCIYIIPVALCFFAEKDHQPIRINKHNWTDLIGFVLFLLVFSYPYYLEYKLIYDGITILTALYCIVIIMRFVYRKLYHHLSLSSA